MQSAQLKPVSCQNEQEFPISNTLTIELIQAAFNKGACFRFQVKGSSMSPFIKDNDIVTLSPLSIAPATLGKPVAYVCPVHKKLVIHRIVVRKNNHYLIKGDNCLAPDCLIQKEDILGCVTSIERENKTIFFSLGFERLAVAFLSRNRVLPGVYFFWRLIPKPLRRFIKCRMLL